MNMKFVSCGNVKFFELHKNAIYIPVTAKLSVVLPRQASTAYMDIQLLIVWLGFQILFHLLLDSVD